MSKPGLEPTTRPQRAGLQNVAAEKLFAVIILKLTLPQRFDLACHLLCLWLVGLPTRRNRMGLMPWEYIWCPLQELNPHTLITKQDLYH